MVSRSLRLLLALWSAACASGAKRGGLRQRLEAEADGVPPPPKARGGVRRRLGSLPDSNGDPRSLPFYRSLKRDWGSGILSSARVQEYSHGAREQGAAGLDRLADAGASGQQAGNLFRDLKRIFGWPSGCAPIRWIQLPTKRGRVTPHPVLWPHEFFKCMFNERLDLFQQRLCGPEGSCKHFWEGISGSMFMRRHPSLPRSVWHKTIPMGFHADGGGFNKHDSLFGLSWNSLATTGTSSVQSRFLFSGIRKSDMVPETLDLLMRAFSWSVNILLAGETPMTDWQGNALSGGGLPLADGWRGQVAQVRGDWQFFCQAFYFPQWNVADVMCPFCRASNVHRERAWYDVGPDAGWRETLWTHETFMAHLALHGLPVPAFFQPRHGIIGLRLENVMVDILHTLDLGMTAHAIGSVLFVFACLRKKFGGSTYEEGASRLASYLKQWYQQTGCHSRIKGVLTLARLRSDKGWAKLKAHGAATRHLTSFALHVLSQFADFDDPHWGLHDRLALAACQLLDRFYEIVKCESLYMSSAMQEELETLGTQFTSIYCRLSHWSFSQHLKIWKLAPKLHLFEHLVMQSMQFGNPAYWWTYADEDLVGRLIRIAHTVHPSTIAESMLCKWAHCVFDELLLDLDVDTWG